MDQVVQIDQIDDRQTDTSQQIEQTDWVKLDTEALKVVR
jgi:hypothetical protein